MEDDVTTVGGPSWHCPHTPGAERGEREEGGWGGREGGRDIHVHVHVHCTVEQRDRGREGGREDVTKTQGSIHMKNRTSCDMGELKMLENLQCTLCVCTNLH